MKLWFKKSKSSDDSPVSPAAPEVAAEEVMEEIDLSTISQALAEADMPLAAVKATDESESRESAVKQEAQPSQRELFKALFDGLYDASIVTDARGFVFNMNSRVSEVLGYEPDDLWDTHISHIAPGITDAVIAKIKSGLAEERHAVVDARCIRKDKTTFPAEIAISTIEITKDGNLLFCVRNTERRQMAMQGLRMARRLLDHLAVPAVACDTSGVIRVANRSIARMLGYDSADVLVGQPLVKVWREERAQDVIQRVLSGETVKEPVVMFNTRGKQLQLVLSLVPDMSPSKKIVGFLASFTASTVVSLTG